MKVSRRSWIAAAALLPAWAGCSTVATPRDSEGRATRAPESDVAALAQALRTLDASVDPHEARALSDLAFNYSLDLADSYRVVHPAVVHNILVNLDLRQRGLCFQWAEDLEARLRQSGLRTLRLYRVVARINTPREHNAIVVAALNQRMREGILLDAWRHGGRLF
jgi:hypothetical protein